jgi:hypothetical protein
VKILLGLAVLAAFLACGVGAFAVYSWKWVEETDTQPDEGELART